MQLKVVISNLSNALTIPLSALQVFVLALYSMSSWPAKVKFVLQRLWGQ